MNNNRLIAQLREILGNAYGFVRGRECTKEFSSLTFEELIDEAIDKLKENKQGNSRESARDRIVKIRQELTEAVDQIKKKPPSAWAMASEGTTPGRNTTNPVEE